MEKENNGYRAHCLVVTYPTQGHINPMLQFSKRLQYKGIKVTLVITHFISNSIRHNYASPNSIVLETISDGYDEGRNDKEESLKIYLDRFREVGSQTLTDLVEKLNGSGCAVDCIVYDAFLPWCLDVARKFGLVGAVFFTQSCAVDSIYYHVYRGLIKLPVMDTEILVPGLPPLKPQDLPSFVYDIESNPAALELVVNQLSSIDKADWLLCNTFYELEQEVVDSLAKLWALRAIGPSIPSMYLDKNLQEDVDYGFNIFEPSNDVCMNWLDDKPKGSVVYVSFGSLAALSTEQMQEISWGLKLSNCYFLFVVRASEEDKLPKNFVIDTKEKGLVVPWCAQLKVLAHEAVGCFITHCGWNSTLEALCLGMPMVAMPHWSDQSTNAKFIMDVWKTGIKAPVDENGMVSQEAIKHCISQILEGERGKEIKRNAEKWKKLAKEVVDEGGSSDKNIDEFVVSLIGS